MSWANGCNNKMACMCASHKSVFVFLLNSNSLNCSSSFTKKNLSVRNTFFNPHFKGKSVLANSRCYGATGSDMSPNPPTPSPLNVKGGGIPKNIHLLMGTYWVGVIWFISDSKQEAAPLKDIPFILLKQMTLTPTMKDSKRKDFLSLKWIKLIFCFFLY